MTLFFVFIRDGLRYGHSAVSVVAGLIGVMIQAPTCRFTVEIVTPASCYGPCSREHAFDLTMAPQVYHHRTDMTVGHSGMLSSTRDQPSQPLRNPQPNADLHLGQCYSPSSPLAPPRSPRSRRRDDNKLDLHTRPLRGPGCFVQHTGQLKPPFPPFQQTGGRVAGESLPVFPGGEYRNSCRSPDAVRTQM